MAVQGDAQCSESRNEHGVALLHATYRSKVIQHFVVCVNECINDPPCMSINFWWDTEKCDLNNKTREHSCRACFVAEPYSTYMKMVKPPANQGKLSLPTFPNRPHFGYKICIHNITFFGNIVYLRPRSVVIHFKESTQQMTLQVIIIINKQGQMISRMRVLIIQAK